MQFILLSQITFHPDGNVRATVVSSRTLGRKEVARRRLEPVPVLRQVSVTHGRPAANTQVVVEAPLWLARQQTIVTLETRVGTGN